MNLFATEGAFTIFFLATLFATWPAVPWNAVMYGGLAVGVVTPFVLFPFTKTFYLAVDLSFRPPEPPDLETPVERKIELPRKPVGTTNPP